MNVGLYAIHSPVLALSIEREYSVILALGMHMRKLGNAAGNCVRNSMTAEMKITNHTSDLRLIYAETFAKRYSMFDRKRTRLPIVCCE